MAVGAAATLRLRGKRAGYDRHQCQAKNAMKVSHTGRLFKPGAMAFGISCRTWRELSRGGVRAVAPCRMTGCGFLLTGREEFHSGARAPQ
jgi:hypothetical protein